MLKRIVIVSNGALEQAILINITPSDYVIGVDRAAYSLLKNHIVPQYAVGDFDSVTKSELHTITSYIKNVSTYKAEKDETDLELALDYATGMSPEEILILGGLGGRMDHALATLFLMEKVVQEGIRIRLQDEHNDILLVNTSITLQKNSLYTYVSLLPFTSTAKVTLTGFKYNGTHILTKDKTIGVSNEITGKSATVKLLSGSIWLIQSKD